MSVSHASTKSHRPTPSTRRLLGRRQRGPVSEPGPPLDPELLATASEAAGGVRFVPGEFMWLPLEELEPHPWNPNEGDLGALADSIDTVGFYGVVYVQHRDRAPSGKYRLLDGEHRWRDLLRRQAPTVPCWVMDLDVEDALRVLASSHRIPRLGRERPEAVASVLDELASTDRCYAGTGWDGDDHDMVRSELEQLTAPPPTRAPDPPPDPFAGTPSPHRGETPPAARHRGETPPDAMTTSPPPIIGVPEPRVVSCPACGHAFDPGTLPGP